MESTDEYAKAEMLGATLKLDGNQWCALIGENIQEGVCGFGDTQQIALLELEVTLLKIKTDDQDNAIKAMAELMVDHANQHQKELERLKKEITETRSMLRSQRNVDRN